MLVFLLTFHQVFLEHFRPRTLTNVAPLLIVILIHTHAQSKIYTISCLLSFYIFNRCHHNQRYTISPPLELLYVQSMPPLGQSKPEGFQHRMWVNLPWTNDLHTMWSRLHFHPYKSPQHMIQQLLATSHYMAHHGLISSSELTHVLASASSFGSLVLKPLLAL
jgi:hypothetical protein